MENKCSDLISHYNNLVSTQEQFYNSLKSVNKGNVKEIKNKILELKNIKEKINEFFPEPIADNNGRIIPGGKDKDGNIIELESSVTDPDPEYTIEKIDINKIDYKERLSRLEESLGTKVGITPEEFKSKTQELINKMESRKDLKNLLNGPCFPIVIPKIEKGDLGTLIEKYLKGVEKSYKKQFPGRKFNNHKKGKLSKQVNIINERYKQFFDKLKQGPTVLLFFPTTMQGYSVDASREQVDCLPEELNLSSIENIFANIVYPDVLVKDRKTTRQNLSSLHWQSPGYSLFFVAFDDKLYFDSTDHLSGAYDDYSAGLSFRG